MKAIGYIRVSTEDQAREGVSLDNQRRKIELYAEMNDIELIGIIADEGVSAKNLNRPGVKKVLAMANKREVDAIIIYKLDRAFRNTIDALQTAQMLDKKGVALHSITEKLDTHSAIGKFFFSLMASLAEMERNVIGERTADALKCKKNKGEKTGGHVPFGFDVRKEGDLKVLTPNEDEKNVIATIVELRNKGLSYRAIAEKLESMDIPMKKGNTRWNSTQIMRIFKTHMQQIERNAAPAH